jgi:signal transduction histidine kinase
MNILEIMRREGPLSRKDLARLNEAEMNSGMEIPHNQVRLEGGVLHADRAETEFVKSMTHELRTPLNVVIGLCQFLKRDRQTPLQPMQRDAVDRMERNARSLLLTVNHLIGCLRSGHFE